MMDHKALGKEIAQSMADDGHVRTAVSNVLSPMLEQHKKDIIEENAKEMSTMATQLGVNCNEPHEMQKDFAHLRTGRVYSENVIHKAKDLGIKGIVLAALLFLGFDKIS